MFAIDSHLANDRADWQSGFICILPQIERLLRHVYRHLDADRQQEAIQSATVFCLLSYMRLCRRGRAAAVTASNLVWYAVIQVKCGRPAGGCMNSKDVMSPYAQRRRGIKVERLHTYVSQGSWIDAIVQDKRSSIGDQVAARMDIRAWLGTLGRRTRKIATDLALGFTTSEAARKYRLSAGRISQMRRELEVSWREFQHEIVLAPAI